METNSYPMHLCIQLLQDYIFVYKNVRIKVIPPKTTKEIELFEKSMNFVIPWFENNFNFIFNSNKSYD